MSYSAGFPQCLPPQIVKKIIIYIIINVIINVNVKRNGPVLSGLGEKGLISFF